MQQGVGRGASGIERLELDAFRLQRLFFVTRLYAVAPDGCETLRDR